AFDDALAALKAGRDAEARTRLQAIAKSDPELAGPHANLGLIARHAGRLDEAVAELERATTLDPRQPVMWNQLGITYRQDGQFAKARAAYEHAIALDPDYATAIVNLGVLEDLYLGEPAQALALYTRYLALTPAGDPLVAKWVADLRNRLPKPAAAPASSAASAAGKESS
ncbi:MAG TPA: tetratricopeptide repeat protein, partial [Burkholderiaceae bacterium]